MRRACSKQYPQAALGAAVLGAVLMWAAPGHALSPQSEAVRAHLAGRHAEAVTRLRNHLAAQPGDATAWLYLGASYYILRQYAPAAAAFDRAYRLRPSGEAALWLGAAYAAQARSAAARAAFAVAARSGAPQTRWLAQRWLRGLRGRSAPVLRKEAPPQDFAFIVRWYNRHLTAPHVDAIVRSVLYYSRAYGVDPRLVMSLIAVESGFQVQARSPAGAYGLGQLMPATWQAMGVHPGDPVGNVYATVRVLRGQLDRFGGNHALALAAYNAGRGTVERYGGIPPYRETQWYVYNVLTLYRHLAGD